MKKLFYILLFAFASSVAITACTDEEVRPIGDAPGGSSETDPIKD